MRILFLTIIISLLVSCSSSKITLATNSIKILSSNLSEDLKVFSTGNDELVFVIYDSIKNIILLEEFKFIENETTEKLIQLDSLTCHKLNYALIEVDTDLSPELIAKSYLTNKSNLGDDEVLGTSTFLNKKGFNILEGVHNLDKFRYTIEYNCK